MLMLRLTTDTHHAHRHSASHAHHVCFVGTLSSADASLHGPKVMLASRYVTRLACQANVCIVDDMFLGAYICCCTKQFVSTVTLQVLHYKLAALHSAYKHDIVRF